MTSIVVGASSSDAAVSSSSEGSSNNKENLHQQQRKLALTPVLKQVHVISRHGARTFLQKDGDTLSEGTQQQQQQQQTTLTPLGHKHLFDLGVWLRNRYTSQDTENLQTGDLNPFGEYKETLQKYNPNWHRIESTGLDRTISSANAMSQGLFPKETSFEFLQEFVDMEGKLIPTIPVYSQKESNDITLRTWRTCPVFHDRLQTLFSSQPWKTLEDNHVPLLEKLSDKFPEYVKSDSTTTSSNQRIRLKDIWNIYDAIHVVRTECGGSKGSGEVNSKTETCESIPNHQYFLDSLSFSEFQELEELMETTERLKFGVGTAGNLLGSNLLWQILGRFGNPTTLYVYSAHAPTILGFLSALKEYSYSTAQERFVEYGSAVIVEVYQDLVNDIYVRLLYKSSDKDDASYLELDHVGCATTTATNGSGTKYCKVTDFLNWAIQNTILTQEDWCLQCQNVESDVCVSQLLEDNAIALGFGNIENALAEDFRNNDPMTIALSYLGGLLSGFVIWGIGMIITNRIWKHRRNYQNRARGINHDGSLMNGDQDNSSNMYNDTTNVEEPTIIEKPYESTNSTMVPAGEISEPTPASGEMS